MIVTCRQCQQTYDDLRCSTVCPHTAFLTIEEAERKDLAMSLLGKDLAWRDITIVDPYHTHMPLRIQSIDFIGFVTLAGGPAHHRYNPICFKVLE